MSILNVNKINPVGGGSTITIAGIASVTNNISVGNSVTATTYFGDGSNLTGISVDSTKIETGNTKVETIDTGSDGHVKVTTEGTERIRINEHGLSIKNSTNTSALCVNNVRGTASAPSFNETNSDGLLVDVYNTGNPYPRYVSLAARGYGSATAQMGFWTDSGSSVAERLIISPDGYVTKPAHPCFDVVKSDANVSSGNYIQYNTVNVNNGNHYNSSNGRFTAPVAGFYFFSYGTIKANTNNVTRLYLHKNGSRIYGHGRHLRMDSGQNYGDNGAKTFVVSLAVNDYIQIKVEEGEAYGATAEYCYFNGFLIG